MMPYVILILSLFVVLTTLLIKRHIKYKRFWKLMDEFYGDKPHPIFGNVLQVGTKAEEFTKNGFKIFERAGYNDYKFLIGHYVVLFLCTPDNIEALLAHPREINKMNEYYYFGDWLGEGLLLSTGNKWRTRRKILTPAFHFKILEQFIKVFNDNGDILVQQLAVKTGELFDIFPFINHYALDVISESAMGVKINAQTNVSSEYVEAVHSMCVLLNKRFISITKKFNWIYKLTPDYKEFQRNKKILHGLTNKVVQTRKVAIKDLIEKVGNGESVLEEGDKFIGKRKKIAFLDLLLLSKMPDGKFLTDEDVREEVDTFMFEGHDTVTSGIAFAIYELSRNQDVQQKAYEETIHVFGEHSSKEITYNDLQDLKYLEMVIRETLRLYPAVPRYGRLLQEDFKLPDGRTIPAGCPVMIDALYLGRSPLVYANPEKFDPDRFAPETTVGRHPFAYIPFSAGPRNCIGQRFALLEIKTVLSKILMNYELICGGDEAKIRLSSEVILKTENGVQIFIKKRRSFK